MAAKKKTVPVTSVTPAIKTSAVSKAQQARTRKLVASVASVTPVGRAAKSAATVAKAVKAEAVMAKAGWNKAAKESYRASVKRGTYAEPKSGVRVKPAAKPVGNPPNDTKAWEGYIDSVSRGGPASGPAGKAKARRVANSKLAKNQVPSAKEPSRIPEIPARGTVKINSAKTVRIIKIKPLKKSAAQLRKKK